MWVPDRNIKLNPGGILGPIAWIGAAVALVFALKIPPPEGGDPVGYLIGSAFITGIVLSAMFGNWLWKTAFESGEEADDFNR